jgi:hypothetical protein
MSEKPPMTVKRTNDTVTITVKLFANSYPSSTGKSEIVFTSKGFQWYEGLGVNLTIIKSKQQY